MVDLGALGARGRPSDGWRNCWRCRRNCSEAAFAEEFDGGLVELGTQLVSLIGLRDVADGKLDATEDRFDVDGRLRTEGTDVATACGAFPFLRGGFRAVLRSLEDTLLDCFDHWIRIFAGGKYYLQFIP